MPRRCAAVIAAHGGHTNINLTTLLELVFFHAYYLDGVFLQYYCTTLGILCVKYGLKFFKSVEQYRRPKTLDQYCIIIIIMNKSQETTVFSGRQKLTSAMKLGQKSDGFDALYR